MMGDKDIEQEETAEILEIEPLEEEVDTKESRVERKKRAKKEKIKKPKKEKVKKEKVEKPKKEKKPRRKIKKKNLIIVLSSVFGVALLTFLALFIFVWDNKVVEPEPEPEPPHEPVVEEFSLSFIGVGDALLHEGVWECAQTWRRGSDGHWIYDFSHQFTYIKEMIAPFDLRFYNQESVIGGKDLGLSGWPMFNSPDEIGTDLVAAGFNLVSLANNHTYDKFAQGALYSANFWKAKENVLAVGNYISQEHRDEVKIKEINGITYTMLAYSYSSNGIFIPPENRFMVNIWDFYDDALYEAYKEQVRKDVERVRDQVDLLMVSMHWGVEYQHVPSARQRDAAQFLASLGVDVIIGHHPHVVQPIEWIDDTLVIYSLGNFISAQIGIERLVGLVAAFDVKKTTIDGVTESVEIVNARGDLIYTHYVGFQNFKVIPWNRMNNIYLHNYRDVYNRFIRYINPKNDPRVQVGFLGR